MKQIPKIPKIPKQMPVAKKLPKGTWKFLEFFRRLAIEIEQCQASPAE